MLKFHGSCELNENISEGFIMRPTCVRGGGACVILPPTWRSKWLPNSSASGLTTPTLLFLPKNQMHLSLFPGLWQKGVLLWAWDHPQTVGSLWTGKPRAHREHAACFWEWAGHLSLGSQLSQQQPSPTMATFTWPEFMLPKPLFPCLTDQSTTA